MDKYFNEKYKLGVRVGKQMSDGMYLVLMEQSIHEDGTFDMMEAFTIAPERIKFHVEAHLTYDVDPKYRGLAKMITAENLLMFGGEVKGYVAKGDVIDDIKDNGKKITGYLLGPLNTMTQKDVQGMMSCLCRGMGHITKDMWYIYQFKGGENKTIETRKMPAAMKK